MRNFVPIDLPMRTLVSATILRCSLAGAVLVLAGCAETAVRENFAAVRDTTRSRIGADVEWLTTDASRATARARVDALLAKPLGADDAVRIALAYSPAVQALLFESAARSAQATQAARPPNPVFAFERLARLEGGVHELEIGRILAFSLYDLLLTPTRLRLAELQQEQIGIELASQVVQAATQTREAWVRAVAAQQSLAYVEQVQSAAEASAELARRMEAAGNFSRLQRAREQAFVGEAAAQLARARQSAHGTREALVRQMGLTQSQATALVLPERLPNLPAMPRDESSVLQAALDERLDLRLARARLGFFAEAQGLTRVTGFVNGFTLAGVRNTETGRAPQRGYDLEFQLPVFDFGDAARLRAEASYMAALYRTAQVGVDATSRVRDAYAAYRTADDLARRYRDEIVPLRKTISEENLLRYNGMLIGVFDLLADAREQVASVIAALDAQRDFWLADAALQAALIGQPAVDATMQATGAARDP